MTDIDEVAYVVANVIARKKEAAILDAISTHFGRLDWKESEVAELVLSMDVDIENRTETLHINLRPMVEFGLIECHIEVETGIVRSLYHQSINPLYGSCGIG